MKATKKLNLKIVICLAVLLLGTVIFAACNNKNKIKYDYMVTFSYNVTDKNGNLRTDNDQYLGVMKNSLVGIRPGYSDRFKETVITGFFVDGWYLAADEDNDGVPDKDDKGKVILGREWDFAHDRVNEDMTLYAKLLHAPVIYYIDKEKADMVDDIIALEEAGVIGMTDAQIASYGIVGLRNCRPGQIVQRPTSKSLQPSKEGFTWLEEFYEDPACTQPVSWTHGSNNSKGLQVNEDKFIYVEFIEGEWELVRTASDFNNKRTRSNIIIMNDIEFQTNEFVPGDQNFEIDGQGHKLKGIVLTGTAATTVSQGTNNKSFALFGALGVYANIHDLTIEDAQYTLTVACRSSSQVFSGLFAGYAAKGAKLTNVTVTGTYKMDVIEGASAQGITWNKWIGSNLMDPEDVSGVTYNISQI